jgi:hypothetical protein
MVQIELVRAHPSTDPFGFAGGPQTYKLRRGAGEFARLDIDWSREFLERLDALYKPARAPEQVRAFGEELRSLCAPVGALIVAFLVVRRSGEVWASSRGRANRSQRPGSLARSPRIT